MRRTMPTLVVVVAAVAMALLFTLPAHAEEAERPARGDRPAVLHQRIEHLRLGCRALTEREDFAVACRWSKSHHPDFAGYRLGRADRENGRSIVFRTDDQDVTRHLDETAEPDTAYVYRVVAVDADGNVIAASRPARVHPPAE